MPAATARENAVLDWMRRRFDHVSAERCSRPGLVNLYNAPCRIGWCRPRPNTGADHRSGDAALDPLCREATAMFCAMLGTWQAIWR